MLQYFLGHHLVVEFDGVFVSKVVVKLTIFGFNHVGFLRTGCIVKFVVLVVLQLLRQNTFVFPGSLLLRDQTFGRAQVLLLVIGVKFSHNLEEFIITHLLIVWSHASELHRAPFGCDSGKFGLDFSSGSFKLVVSERYF